jgi:catechol 2,3-dioxygenase-like lactoylglutathione lyase family enzyme
MSAAPDMIVLYVKNLAASVTYYGNLLGKKPAAETPAFSMFALDSGLLIGLWQVDYAQPPSSVTGGGCELVINLESRQAVDSLLAQWRDRGVKADDAVEAPFGYTFVTFDPDQHRIRAMYTPME